MAHSEYLIFYMLLVLSGHILLVRFLLIGNPSISCKLVAAIAYVLLQVASLSLTWLVIVTNPLVAAG